MAWVGAGAREPPVKWSQKNTQDPLRGEGGRDAKKWDSQREGRDGREKANREQLSNMPGLVQPALLVPPS